MNNPTNYWASSPFPHPVEYPVTMYHATLEATRVNNPEEEKALGEEWSRNYADKKRDWPKAKYKLKTGPRKPGEVWYEALNVANPEEEGKLEGAWSDTVPPEPAEPAAPAAKARPL
jgi:hypothetical protein